MSRELANTYITCEEQQEYLISQMYVQCLDYFSSGREIYGWCWWVLPAVLTSLPDLFKVDIMIDFWLVIAGSLLVEGTIYYNFGNVENSR